MMLFPFKKAIAEKRKLSRIWQNTHQPNDKTNLNNATKKLKELLHSHKNKAIQSFLESLTPTETTDYSLWKATKKIKHPQISIPPIRKTDGNWARTNKEKADTFAKHLSNVFQPFPATDEEDEIIQFLKTPPLTDLPIKAIKTKEVKMILKNVNTKKAPGFDLITGKI